MSSNNNKKSKGKSKSGKAPANNPAKARAGRQAVQRAPVAIGNRTFQQRAKMMMSFEKAVVHHSEYIGDITGSASAFAVALTVPMNAGLSQSFPWLNQIASRYESYKFRKLNYRFMTERPTTESGYVALIPDYDPTDPAPPSKTLAFQYQSAAKAAPWENLTQVNTPSDLSKRKEYFVRQGPLTANENIAFYDTGNLYVLVGGNSGAVTLGELWCDYEVELMTPQLETTGLGGSGKIVGATAQSNVLPFGTGATSTFSRSPIWSYSGVDGRLTFLQPYQGLFSFDVVGTVIGAATTAGSTATVTELYNYLPAGSLNAGLVGIIDAQIGQTLYCSLAAASTFTSAVLRLGDYSYALS